MGPRRIRRGEQGFAGGIEPGWHSLQWGHGEFAVENHPHRGRYRQPREPPSAEAAAHHSAGFNGATANSPWRTRDLTDRFGADKFASMGPRRIRRGEPSAPNPLTPWNRTLQWGHGEFAVENVGKVGLHV